MCKKHFTYSNGICKPKLGSSVSGLHSLYILNQQRSTFTDLSQGVIRHCSNELGSTKFYHKCYTVKTEQIELIDEQNSIVLISVQEYKMHIQLNLILRLWTINIEQIIKFVLILMIHCIELVYANAMKAMET